MNYGLTIENQNLIINKAKTKKNGVYCFRGVSYKVVDGSVTHFAYNRQILAGCGVFNVVVGACGFYQSEQVKALQGIKL